MKNRTKTQLLLLTCLTAAMTPAGAEPVGTLLDEGKVKSVLTQAWQAALRTDRDPANNNKWNTHNGGSGFGVGGLYGGLQETLLATTFDAPVRRPVQFVTKNQITVPNNTDGVLTYAANLEFTDSESVTDSSSVSNSLKTGAEVSFKVSASLYGMGAEAGGKFSEDFTRTNASSNTTTTVKQQKFANTLSVVVPPRRTYQVTLVCQEEGVDLRYRSDIKLSGVSQTWFDNQVNSHYNWSQNVGALLAHLPALPPGWSLPGDGSVLITGVEGKLTAQQAADCSVTTADITGLPSGLRASPALVRGNSVAHSVPAGAALVSVTPFRR